MKPARLRKRYKSYIQSNAWKSLRLRIIARDGGKCVRCGSNEELEVHHKTYKRFGRERDAELETLCWNCHRTHHDLEPIVKKSHPPQRPPDKRKIAARQYRQATSEWQRKHDEQVRRQEDSQNALQRIFFVTE